MIEALTLPKVYDVVTIDERTYLVTFEISLYGGEYVITAVHDDYKKITECDRFACYLTDQLVRFNHDMVDIVELVD